MRRQRGMVYLWALVLVFLLGLGLGKALEVYSTQVQREREAELLYVGNLYRQAIYQYYLSSPGYRKRFPEKLEDLLKDPRYLTTRRYLRRLYLDPVTNQPFLVVPAPEGGIMGVVSGSGKRPVKREGFGGYDAGFEGAESYGVWRFVVVSGSATSI